jgi:hypothetical protein
MSRPVEATSALDLDTIKLILWASEYGSGHPNISRLYDKEATDGLVVSRGTFFNAIKGRRVTSQVLDSIDEMVAIRGWRPKYLSHLQEQHNERVIQAFKKSWTSCSVCGHACSNCGAPESEKRRKAVTGFLKTDPATLGCKVREPAARPDSD